MVAEEQFAAGNDVLRAKFVCVHATGKGFAGSQGADWGTQRGPEEGRLATVTPGLFQPVVPDDPELKRAVHSNDNAYAIVAMPGTEAQSFSCNKRKKLRADASYYGSVFRFRTTDGNDPAT